MRQENRKKDRRRGKGREEGERVKSDRQTERRERG